LGHCGQSCKVFDAVAGGGFPFVIFFVSSLDGRGMKGPVRAFIFKYGGADSANFDTGNRMIVGLGKKAF